METSAFLSLSIAVNIVLLALSFLLHRQKKTPVTKLTLSAEDLLHDLTRGPAVVRIDVIDAKNLLLRRPS